MLPFAVTRGLIQKASWFDNGQSSSTVQSGCLVQVFLWFCLTAMLFGLLVCIHIRSKKKYLFYVLKTFYYAILQLNSLNVLIFIFIHNLLK